MALVAMMRHVIVSLLGSALVHAAGAAERTASSSAAAPIETTVCELARSPPSIPTAFVHVRARLRLDYHWGGISDDRCPDDLIFLDWMEGGPSMSFCHLNFGCPANTESYRIMGTFVGYYYQSAKGVGRLRLKELRDPERQPL
jgi:hypothetical protein